jgi:hypothetical protein
MDEIVGFVSKSELERVRLIREAREIYDSIFRRPMRSVSRRMTELARVSQPGLKEPACSKGNVRMTGHS